MELSCKSCPVELFVSLRMELCKSFLPILFLKLLRGIVCKSCLSNLFFELLFGTVEQKLTCKAISQGKMSISISRMLRCALK